MKFNPPSWIKQTILFGILSSVASTSFAIDSLQISLQVVIEKALANSKYIQQSQLQVQEKEIDIQQQRMALLPKVSLRGSASYATNMPIYDNGIFNKPSQHDVIHYLYDTGADFYLNLYNGHRDLMKIKSAKLEKEIADINWLAANAQIKMDVCNHYLDLQRSFAHRKLILKDIEDQKAQLKQVRDLLSAGAVLQSDVLRIELELSKRELLLIEIGHDIQSIQQKLTFITGLSEQIIPVETLNNETILDYEKIIATAKHQAFILQRSEQEVQLKELAIKQAKSNTLPELGLTGNYTFANPQIFLYPYNDSWYSLGIVGLKLNIPISAIYHNKNVVRSAHVALKQQEVKHHHEEDEVEAQILKAYLDYKLANEEQTVCLKNVALAQESARIIKNRYFKSAALVTDLLDADMKQLQTLFELESSKIAVQKYYYLIEFLKGTI